jgi:hypothetical protein
VTFGDFLKAPVRFGPIALRTLRPEFWFQSAEMELRKTRAFRRAVQINFAGLSQANFHSKGRRRKLPSQMFQGVFQPYRPAAAPFTRQKNFHPRPQNMG